MAPFSGSEFYASPSGGPVDPGDGKTRYASGLERGSQGNAVPATCHSPRTLTSSTIVASDEAIQRLESLATDLGEKFHKILVAIGAYRDVVRLRSILTRMPPRVVHLVSEIAVFDVFSEAEAEQGFESLGEHPAREKLKYYRVPRRYGYGENLKNCFDYALEKEFDYILIIRGDGAYNPAYIADFLVAALIGDCPVVIGNRISGRSKGESWWRSPRLVANRLLSAIEELVLGMGLKDYHCGYRLIRTDVLRRIPYAINCGDYLFDLQLLIQIRCLRIGICTVPVFPFHDQEIGTKQAATYAVRAIGMTLTYRMHQLHLVRRANYFVDLGEIYTLKRNRFSSHMQILESIRPGSTVLDLGCGQSLLAEEYARRGIKIVGVDAIPPEQVSPFVHEYNQCDLERPCNLPYGRKFDYVVLSDIIEHIVNRDAVMKSVRRHLKLDGQLIASTGNIAIWFYRASLLLGRFEYGPRGVLDRTHTHLFTVDTFTRFFVQRGFRILDVRYAPIPFELVFSSTGRSTAVAAITKWYYCLTRLWPRLFAYQCIVCCTFRSYESAMGEQMWTPDLLGPGTGSPETGLLAPPNPEALDMTGLPARK